MTAALGISTFYQDPAAALIGDGEMLGAAQEKRIIVRKHAAAFRLTAIEHCLENAGLTLLVLKQHGTA